MSNSKKTYGTSKGKYLDFASLKVGDNGKFRIRRKENVSGVWQDVGEELTGLFGVITNMELSSYEYKGKKQHTLIMYFDFPGTELNSLKLESNFNYAIRSLLNSVMGFIKSDEFDGSLKGKDFDLSVWDKNKGDELIPSLKVEIDGFRMDWLFKLDDEPLSENQFYTLMQSQDTDAMDRFFVEKFNEIIKPLFQ